MNEIITDIGTLAANELTLLMHSSFACTKCYSSLMHRVAAVSICLNYLINTLTQYHTELITAIRDLNAVSDIHANHMCIASEHRRGADGFGGLRFPAANVTSHTNTL